MPREDPAYRALVSDAGIVELDGWTTVAISGADRATFLHNMCTAEIRALAPGQGAEAFFTDVRGKIIAHGVVLAGAAAHWFVGAPGQGARLAAHLEKYVVREDVTLADRTTATRWQLVAGPRAAERLAAVRVDVAALDASWRHAEGAIAAARAAWFWTDAYLVGAEDDPARRLRASLESAGAALVGHATWEALRIESGFPLAGVDFDGGALPQEIGRDAAAISFRKGCYLGQETIARIDALGHVNRHVATLRFAGVEPPVVGVELRDAQGQLAGAVTSARWSPGCAAPLALALVRRGSAGVGTALTCGDREATVVATPAVSRS